MFYINSAIQWLKAHDCKWKIVNNVLYWRTNFQTAEQHEHTIIWRDWDYFDTI